MRPPRLVGMTWVTTVVVATTACGDPGPKVIEPSDPPGPHEADLNVVRQWMMLDKSWPSGALEQAQAKLAALEELPTVLPDVEFYLAIAEITALADNGHSNISRLAIYNTWGILPIRAFWFTDGLFIVRASPGNGELLGGEIRAIAGRTPGELMETMGAYYGGSDEFLRAYFIHSMLFSPALLAAAGVTPVPDRITLTVTLQSGEERIVDIPEFPATAPFGLPWRYLAPDPIPGENSWVTVLDPANTPWAFRDRSQPFRYRFIDSLQVSHVQLRANRDLNGVSITQFIANVTQWIAADQPEHIILDVRENDGGSLNNTSDWALALHDALPPDGIVFSLTSNATFSAGIYTAFFPEAAQPDRTVIVGSLVGDRPRFFAEGDRVTLPESGHRVNYSDFAHHLTARCGTSECLFANQPDLDIIVQTLTPEVEGGLTFADFAAGRDADVDLVLALIAN